MENVNEKQIDWLFKEEDSIKYSGMKDICRMECTHVRTVVNVITIILGSTLDYY